MKRNFLTGIEGENKKAEPKSSMRIYQDILSEFRLLSIPLPFPAIFNYRCSSILSS